MAFLSGLLVFTSWLERRVVSPEALILASFRAHTAPEVTETVVTEMCGRLIPEGTGR